MSDIGLWTFLRRGWWLVVLTTVFALAGAALVTLTTAEEYEATALLRVQDTAGAPERAEEALDAQLAGAALARSYAVTLDSESFLAQMAADVGDGTMTASELEETINVEVLGEPGAEVDLVSLTVLAESPEAAVTLASDLAAEFAVAVRAGGPRAPEITLVAPPVASSDPVTPRPALNLLVGAAVGVVLGIGLAWLWEKRPDVRKSSTAKGVAKARRVEQKPVDSKSQGETRPHDRSPVP